MGSFDEGLALEMVANQEFNRTTNAGAAFARQAALWRDLPRRRDPDLAAEHEAAFEERTGATLDDAFHVGALFFMQSRADGQAVFGPDYLSSLKLTAGENAAVDLYVADLDRIRQLLEDEMTQVGEANGLSWGVRTFKRFPLVRHPNGFITLLDPELLLQRTCGTSAHWELVDHFNKFGGSKGKRLYGGFKSFRGLVEEDYVGDSLRAMAPALAGAAQRLWTEEEMQAIWPGLKGCDFVIDFGSEWVCVEVVSHALTEKPSTASSVERLDEDMKKMVEEKAVQLDATIGRLLADDSVLTGRSTPPGKQVRPVIVATNGFPASPVTNAVISDRLRAAGLLQQPLVGPLEVVDLDDIEAIEAIQETGGPSFAEILATKSSAGMGNAAMDQFMYTELRLPLNRPRRVNRLMKEQFDQLQSKVAARDGLAV